MHAHSVHARAEDVTIMHGQVMHAHVMHVHVMQAMLCMPMPCIVCFMSKLTVTCQLSLWGQNWFKRGMPTQLFQVQYYRQSWHVTNDEQRHASYAKGHYKPSACC